MYAGCDIADMRDYIYIYMDIFVSFFGVYRVFQFDSGVVQCGVSNSQNALNVVLWLIVEDCATDDSQVSAVCMFELRTKFDICFWKVPILNYEHFCKQRYQYQ